MARIIKEGYTLKIYGEDIINADNSLNRAGLRNALFSNTNRVNRVRNLEGEVDFIVCFVQNGPPPSNFAGEDNSLTPRPLRGMIFLAYDLEKFTLANLEGLLGGAIGHEVGHYWLVPRGAQIKDGSGTLHDLPTENEVAEKLNQGLEYPPYPILGRGNKHWSPFIDGNGTSMEAPNLGEPIKTPGIGFIRQEEGYDQIQGEIKEKYTFDVPDLGQVQAHTRFSTLERYIIGSYKIPYCQRMFSMWPKFRVFVPRWTFDLGFEAGLYLKLQSGKTYYIGYYKGPNKICVHNLTEPNPDAVYTLDDDPFDPFIKVGARIVQIGERILLQLRLWRPRSYVRISFDRRVVAEFRKRVNVSYEDIMNDMPIEENGEISIWQGWRTFLSIDGKAQLIGISSRTIENKAVHTLLSAKICLYENNNNTPVSVISLNQDFPHPGPVLLDSKQLMMPYKMSDGTKVKYPETDAEHQAPKLTMEAPDGDFAFGGLISLDRCVQVTWAGGLRPGVIMVGKSELIPVKRYILSMWDSSMRTIKQSDPLNGRYNVLFCAASRDEAAAPITTNMMANLDKIRKAWHYFSFHLMKRDSNTEFI